jgi:hypothetical protein
MKNQRTMARCEKHKNVGISGCLKANGQQKSRRENCPGGVAGSVYHARFRDDDIIISADVTKIKKKGDFAK